MANPRLPSDKAKVSGADVKNPGRHADRKKPKGTRPIGEPFKGMTVDQAEAWECFKSELPWLNSSHRALLQAVCVLRARLNVDPDIGVNALTTYSAMLSKLAATPVDETKVSYGDGEEEDPADQFFGRPH